MKQSKIDVGDRLLILDVRAPIKNTKQILPKFINFIFFKYILYVHQYSIFTIFLLKTVIFILLCSIRFPRGLSVKK